MGVPTAWYHSCTNSGMLSLEIALKFGVFGFGPRGCLGFRV